MQILGLLFQIVHLGLRRMNMEENSAVFHNSVVFHIAMSTKVSHYGKPITLAELKEQTEDKEQFQRLFNDYKLEVVSKRLNEKFGSDIEDFHWSCFLGVHYYDHIEWGLRDDDCSDQLWFLEDLIENIPTEIISKLIQIWEKSNCYLKATEDLSKLKDNVWNSFKFLKAFQEKGIYLPTLIHNIIKDM